MGAISYPGWKPKYTVYGHYPHLGFNTGPGFKRFRSQPVFFSTGPQDFLRLLGIPETHLYDRGDWFFEVEVDIQDVRDMSGKPIPAIRVATQFHRLPNQTFDNKEAFKKIMERMAQLVPHEGPQWTALYSYIKDRYPERPAEFITVSAPSEEGDVGIGGNGTHPKFLVYDARTAQPMRGSGRTAMSGEHLTVAVRDTVRGSWCGPQRVSRPNGCRSFTLDDVTVSIARGGFRVTEADVKGLGLLEEIGPSARVFDIGIHKLSRFADGVWTDIEPGEYRANSQFRPVMNIHLRVEDERPKVCTVLDARASERSGQEAGKRRGTGGGGPGRNDRIMPFCDRHEGFLCEIGAGQHNLLLNRKHPWVIKYMRSSDRTKKTSEEMWQHMNSEVGALAKPMTGVRSAEPWPTAVLPPEGEEWKDHEDMVINMFFRERIREDGPHADAYIIERMSRIDAGRSAEESAQAEDEAAACEPQEQYAAV